MMRKTLCGLLGTAALFVVFSGSGGCGSDEPVPDPTFDSGTVDPTGNNTICLRVNCEIDRDCKDCESNAKVCNQKEHRCIACGPNAGGKGCPPGQDCTQYGDCVSASTPACTTDASGEPTVTCKADSDCGRCDPKHRACDAASGKCVGCTDTNRKMCQTTDACIKNKCQPQCPDGCATDSDCSKCGEGDLAKHACVSGQCGFCNDKVPCPAGKTCNLNAGTCENHCGQIDGIRDGVCTSDADCANCETGTKKCKLPVNGGLGDCVFPSPGCEGLGANLTLPAPFDRVTQTCSNDSGCANVSADINIGKLLRQITGISAIKDASIKYPMHACASVGITGSGPNEIRCGVCVPCKKDADCSPIDVLQVAAEMFGPLGGIAAAILLDQIFGPSDRKVYMHCSIIGNELGYCAPCPNFLTRCGRTNDPPDPNAKCEHTVCEEGSPLKADPSCEQNCAAEICAVDPFCCNGRWDYSCTRKVGQLCTKKVCITNSCIGKKAGSYCGEANDYDYYKCDDNQKRTLITQCGSGKKCHRTDPNDIRSTAELNGDGTVKCY
ncbi:MAG: hypothetical protein U0174_06235 [Polyangiaceae bacterium]